ncbi:ATP-binding protein [Brevundimonas sp. NIBR11]|uniref:hybrid sensor histidine kinase/response regulator n=1 Tax=Brevundimonas sp. NIBR11 TaxID=3015999 RepID=UPI0022F129F7|nr:ATP-binding protein [Brevundimonas sp. NIBR11]WGM29808.1 Sensor histidine kinase RcsC [Brevundimonas sp. NIBR11]
MTEHTPETESDGIALAALESSGAGWWRILDVETAWWSPRMYELFGRKAEDGVPSIQELYKLYHPDDATLAARSIMSLFRSDEPVSLRYRAVHPSGEVRQHLTWGRRQPPDDQGRRWLVGMVLDITDQVDDEHLIEDKRAFRFVADHTSDMVVRHRMGVGITYVSPASHAVLGYSPAEMLGREPASLVHPDDVQRIRTLLADRIARRETVSTAGYEYRGIHKDGHEVWLEANPRLVVNGAGEMTEIVDVVRDITARKQAEAELHAARIGAEAASRAKSEFLANMSHELRTPLTSILGFSRLIGAGGGLSEGDRGYLDLIRSAGETLLTVVNDILDFSKLEAGALSLDPEPFSVAALGEGATALLREQAEAKGLTLTCEVDDDARLTGDVTRLRQVLLNLLSNAVKFTASGSVRLTMTTDGRADGTTLLQVSVTDTGCGLDPAHIDQMFDRFTQADGSVSRKFGGTGLGLAISRRLLDIMGGEIGASSDGATGSSFWFRVPLATTQTEQTESDEQAGAALERPLRVLLAEDNPANQTLIAALLGSMDVALDMVENGEEAVRAAASTAYDLILMDMQMPLMDGPAATRAIRASGDLTPVVALTANVLPEQIEQCRAAGMQGHVAKPIDPRALMAALSEYARPAHEKAAAA